jgi:hypothetical protein
MLRWAGIVVVLAATAALAVPRADSRPPGSDGPSLALGPVLAGSRVVWGEREGSTFRVRTSSGRVLYERTAGAVGLALEQLAASPQLVAVRLAVEDCPPPTGGTASQCNLSHPVEYGAPDATLSHEVREQTCPGGALSIADSLDVSGNVLVTGATYDAFCDPAARHLRRHVVVHGATTRQLADADATTQSAPGDVRAAGRFVAWSDVDGRRIVVYDLRARRRAYVVDVGGTRGLGFDVQEDGKLAVADEGSVEWFRPGDSNPHRVLLRSASTEIRINGDRIAFVAAGGRRLVLWPIGGRIRTVARFERATADFDLSGDRMTWATMVVTSSRIDCGPPGTGRPCIRVYSGASTIWVTRLGAKPARIAQLPFTDAPLPSG